MPSLASAGSRADEQIRIPSVSDSDTDPDEEAMEVELEEEIEAEEEEEEEIEEEEPVEEEEQDEEEGSEEEEVEEEPDEEEGVEGEPYEEEGVEAEEDVANSHNLPRGSGNFDVKRGSESKSHDKRFGSGSSMTEKRDSSPVPNSNAGRLKSTTPSDDQSTTLKDSFLSFEDSKNQSSGKEKTLTEDKGSRETFSWKPSEKLEPKNQRVHCSNGLYPLCNTEIFSVEKTDVCDVSGEKLVVPIISGDCIGEKFTGALVSEGWQTEVRQEDDKGKTASGSRLAATDVKRRNPSPGAEIKEIHKRSAIICEFFAKGWCIKGKSCRFLHIKDHSNSTNRQTSENRANGTMETQYDKERISKHGERDNNEISLRDREEISLHNFPVSSLKDVGRNRPSQNWPVNGHDNSSSVFNGGNPSIVRSSFLAAAISSSQHVSTQTRSLPSSSFHIETSASGAPKLLENRREYNMSGSFSRLQSASSFSGPEPENNPASHRTKVISNDWEPSEPFRPSFAIPPTILPSCGTLYDPFRDSVDIPNNVREFSDDKNSSCNESTYHKAVPENACERLGVDSGMAGAEMVATSVVDQNETIMPKKGNSSMPSHVKDVSKRKKADVSHDQWHRSDGSSHRKVSKADRAKIVDDTDGEVRSDAGMFKETKVMRHLRAALVDTVKEILKPTWREGHLSKDKHNVIVKKAVAKILGTVQCHQVPKDIEAADQYLSSSRPKIAKLVEGYLERYRRS